MKKGLLAATLWIALAPTVAAQIPERLDSVLRAIFERNEYTPESLPPFVWLDGGRRYAMLTPDGRVTAFDTESGRETTLATAEELRAAGRVASFAMAADNTKLLLFTNTERVWRLNTRGDYWLFDLATRRLRQIGRDAPRASLMFAKFSPDGRQVAYVRQQNLYVETLQTGTTAALTTDTVTERVNGTSDWVNEEELFIRDAFRWSPDGRHIAYLQFDTSDVGRFTLINNTDEQYPKVVQFPYPKAGATNSAVRLGVVPVAGGATRWMAAPGDPREHYIPRFQWLDSTTLAFHHTVRRQNASDLLIADSQTGSVKKVYGETSQTWLDAVDPTLLDPANVASWLREHTLFTWLSDRDGWRHIYLVSRDTGRDRLVTRFNGDVMAIVGVDQTRERIYFSASPQNATQRYLYVANARDESITRVTPPSLVGTHTYDLSPDGRWAFHTYSRADVPPRIDLVSLPDHEVQRHVVTNEAMAQRVAALVRQATEFAQIDIGGGVTLDALVIKPATFDPARKYPVIVYAYTEPANTTVDDRWAGTRNLALRAIANEGYIVVMFDNRGTPVPKGAAWRKIVYGSIGDLGPAEQAAAVKQFATTHAYVDATRVAIHGHSAGGSATLHAMFRFPDVYRVGIASAPASDQRLYDTIYQERYMGLPVENPDGYFRGSPINFAKGLRGHLLLMHGTGDDNVHLQNTERLVNRLIELGKDFDEVLYPNRTHALNEGTGTTYHRWRTIARYLLEHLVSGPTP